MRPVLASLILGLAACAEIPALDDRLTEADRTAPYPQLTALGPVLARADDAASAARETAAGAGAVDARVADLRARAAALRGPVVPAATRERMGRGVDTTALQ